MDACRRLAIYHAPRPGPLADWGARWLGWDAETGSAVARPDLPGLPRPPSALTVGAGRYGFHGTLRAPFRPAPGVSVDAVVQVVAQLAARLAPARCAGLRLADLDGFVALVPDGPDDAIRTLAAAVVEATDTLRAPLTDAEIARRRPHALSSRQRALLHRWGYPFVMEEFRFHLTLTDRLPGGEVDRVLAVLGARLGPILPRPFAIDDLCLLAEDDAGRFHLIRRLPLTA